MDTFMKKIYFLTLFASTIWCCNNDRLPSKASKQVPLSVQVALNEQTTPASTPVKDIPLPKGYRRVTCQEGTFPAWLRQLKLKSDKTVYLFNGQKKFNQTAQYAVLDVSVGKRDLQQCADAIMRLRGEYFYGRKEYHKIEFHNVEGNLLKYTNYAGTDYSYPKFLKYMDKVFSEASTLSLSKEVTPLVNPAELRGGDIFIKGGAPGHAVIVLDVAQNIENKQIIFLLAQSYMPAQDIHILKNPNNNTLSPWYATNFGANLETPEWTFEKHRLSRFPN
jgi:Domain of unknown function (4846)